MPVIIDGTNGVQAAAVTTTSWNPTNLVIPGNATIGDAAGDTLTINAGTTTFATTAARILGDFSNSTIANRLAFQDKTVNNNTIVGIIPNGTATVSALQVNNSSDLTTPLAFGNLQASSSEVSLQSGIRNGGTYVPLTFYTNNAERMRITTIGKTLIGLNTSKYYGGTLQVTNTIQAVGNYANDIVSVSAQDYNAMDSTPTWANVNITKYGPSATGTLYSVGTIQNASWCEVNGINSNGLAIGTNNSSPVVFGTSGAERARIDGGGNVGVGTSTGLGTNGKVTIYETAGARLFLSDSILGTSYGAVIKGSGVAGSGGQLSLGVVDANAFNESIRATAQGNTLSFFTTSGVNGTTTQRMILEANGNVGIGTSGQNAKLSVFGSAGRFSELLGNTIQVRIAGTEGGWNSLIGFANNAGTFLGGILGNGVGQAISDLRFGVGSSPGALIIDSSGYTKAQLYSATTGLETARFAAGTDSQALLTDIRYRAVQFYSQTTGSISSNAGCASGTGWVDFNLTETNSTWECNVMLNHNADGSGSYRTMATCIIQCDVSWNNVDYTPHLHYSPIMYNYHNTMTITPYIYDAYSNAEYSSMIPTPTGSSAHSNSWWNSSNVRLRIKFTGYNSSAGNGPGAVRVWLRKMSAENV